MDTEKVQTQALELKSKYEGLVIKDDASFKAMKAFEDNGRENIKIIKDFIKPQKEEANRRHKKLTQLEKTLTAPFEEVMKGAKQKRIAYSQEQQRIQQEARRKAQEALDRVAEEERLQLAKTLEESGNKEQAEAILETPVIAPQAPVVEAPKVAGSRKVYSAKIVDIKALFKGYVDGSTAIPELSEDDLKKLSSILKLNSLAKALKSSLDIPGVEVKVKVV